MENYSLSDIAAASGEGLGGSSAWILIILFALIFGWGGNGFGGNNNTAATEEILSGQKFDALSRQINQVGDGLASSTFALNNTINGVQTVLGGAISDLKYDNAMQNNATQAMIHAEGESTRAMIQQNKIETLQSRVNQLEMANMMSGVVKYPMATTYSSGVNPFCGCGCNNI